VSASVNLPLHHKVQKFSSGTGSPGHGLGKRAVKRLWCGGGGVTVVWWSVCHNRKHYKSVSEPIEMSFGKWTRVGP